MPATARRFRSRAASVLRTTGRGSVALLVLTVALAPEPACAQVEVTGGLLLVRDGPGGDDVIGAALAARITNRDLGFTLALDVGVARTDLTVLGQEYHDDHLLLALGSEWVPWRGRTGLGLRLGVGAYRESQTVETDPPVGGGVNWIEMILGAVVLSRELGADRDLVVSLSDAALGNPLLAALDPDEYGIEHRFRLMVGVRF